MTFVQSPTEAVGARWCLVLQGRVSLRKELPCVNMADLPEGPTLRGWWDGDAKYRSSSESQRSSPCHSRRAPASMARQIAEEDRKARLPFRAGHTLVGDKHSEGGRVSCKRLKLVTEMFPPVQTAVKQIGQSKIILAKIVLTPPKPGTPGRMPPMKGPSCCAAWVSILSGREAQ